MSDAELSGPYSFSYAPAGARDLLVGHYNEEDHRFQALWRDQQDARVREWTRLFDDACALFLEFGYLSKRMDGRDGPNWLFELERSEAWLAVHVTKQGSLRKALRRDGRDRELPFSFEPEVAWDPHQKIWLGGRIGERNLESPGVPPVRKGALEALVETLVVARKAWADSRS